MLTTMLVEERVIDSEPPAFSIETTDVALGNTV